MIHERYFVPNGKIVSRIFRLVNVFPNIFVRESHVPLGRRDDFAMNVQIVFHVINNITENSFEFVKEAFLTAILLQ